MQRHIQNGKFKNNCLKCFYIFISSPTGKKVNMKEYLVGRFDIRVFALPVLKDK